MKPETRAIILQVCNEHRIGIKDVLSPSQRREPTMARHEAIRRVKAAKPTLTSTQLGRIFDRHHASILNALGRLKRNG